jgi:VWFA-related protein
MKRTHARRLCAACFPLLIALALAGLAFAQAPPRAGQPAPRPGARLDDTPTFGERIEVRVVNVEVVVTDKSGNRVTGLSAADFRLKVDGKEAPIEYFSEIRGGDAVVPGPTEGPPVAGLPSLAPGSPVGTSYLVFIDDYFSLLQRRDEVLRSLKDDLARLQPEDRMAIVAYDGKKLTMLSSWTDNQSALGRAFQEAMRRPAHGLERVAELHSFDSGRRLGAFNFDQPRRGFLNNRLDIEELSYAQRLAGQVGKSIDAAVSTLRSFASPPGRKVMLLLSGGWPYSPADYAVNNGNRPILDRDVPTGEALLRPLADTANLLGYTVYPVDVPGLDGTTTDAAQEGPPPTSTFPVRQQETYATLDFVAQETGGRALRSGLRLAALANASGDTRSYYWLGFTPARKGDDKRHNVQVEVRKPGLKVRARTGYIDLSKNGEGAMMVESAMLFGSPPGSESLPIEVGAAVSSGRREIEVQVKLALPVAAMTVVPLEGKFRTELELRAAALDEQGNRSDIPVVPIKLSFNESPAVGKYVPYNLRMKLRKARQHLVLALFDPIGGKILTAEADINPPK